MNTIDSDAAGGSMGGELVSVTMEINPKPYMGGLDLCGSVGPTHLAFEHRFAMRTAFDYYFPNVRMCGVMPFYNFGGWVQAMTLTHLARRVTN